MKKSPQRQRRRELIEAWQDVKLAVAIRDGFACIVCGHKASTVNHILSRGAWKSLFTDERNLACLCPDHDNADTNTELFVRLQFKIMKSRYPQYDYSELPYRWYLEEPAEVICIQQTNPVSS